MGEKRNKGCVQSLIETTLNKSEATLVMIDVSEGHDVYFFAIVIGQLSVYLFPFLLLVLLDWLSAGGAGGRVEWGDVSCAKEPRLRNKLRHLT